MDVPSIKVKVKVAGNLNDEDNLNGIDNPEKSVESESYDDVPNANKFSDENNSEATGKSVRTSLLWWFNE